ncbi:ComF family protein [Aliikangiella sp. IMCC44359]|uniref:ComF family protein n=1 Tax=Aliikangiella sp. IMCC44359 TaxID=3459125 RepID=UPI00403AAB17
MFFKLNKFISNLLPQSDCPLCQSTVSTYHKQNGIICHYCHQRLPRQHLACTICALPLFSGPELICGECIKQAPNFRKTVAAFRYEPPIKQFITRLKFNAQREFLPILSQYLCQKIVESYHSDALPQQMIPVPLHFSKIRQRGFNQANLIAQSLSQQLKIPMHAHIVKRIRDTSPQTSLDASERHSNLKDAFFAQPPIKSHIAIVDDVMTTGATVSSLSKTLLTSGARRVDVWCLARAYTPAT